MAAPEAIAVTRALEAVMREDRGRLIAALIARLRDFQLAEEALQEAAISALSHWGRAGLPSSPQGWLLKVALRKAIDRLRSGAREARKAADLAHLAGEEAEETAPEMIPDERLRLIFTCCHPALEPKSQIALTLRTLGGLTTPEIARAFLDAEPTMGQRLSRAKAKIAAAGIPFRVPGPEDWDARLNSVLTVIYLIFTQGHSLGPGNPRDLCAEAIFLARLIDQLRPDQAETEGCLALMLLTDARAPARLTAEGETVPLQGQDRALWSGAKIDQGRLILDRAIARRKPGPFQIKAAIASLHCAEGQPDWPQIMLLYARLYSFEPSPIIRLNLAVARAEVEGAEAGLAEMMPLAETLAEYQPFHAACGEYFARANRAKDARAAYDRAIALTTSAADLRFLTRKRDALPS
jgi:RNA polymerase sigma factor (sigma-70 family)